MDGFEKWAMWNNQWNGWSGLNLDKHAFSPSRKWLKTPPGPCLLWISGRTRSYFAILDYLQRLGHLVESGQKRWRHVMSQWNLAIKVYVGKYFEITFHMKDTGQPKSWPINGMGALSFRCVLINLHAVIWESNETSTSWQVGRFPWLWSTWASSGNRSMGHRIFQMFPWYGLFIGKLWNITSNSCRVRRYF